MVNYISGLVYVIPEDFFLCKDVATAATAKLPQSCLTPSDPMDCSLLGSSIHEIFQPRVLEWGAVAFSVK